MAELEQWAEWKWTDLAEVEEQTVIATGQHRDIHWMIKRAGWSLTAYVGVALPSPTAEFGEPEEILVHGGWTFGPVIGNGEDGFEEGIVWWGWDYSHAGDRIMWPKGISVPRADRGTEWTPNMVHTQILVMLPKFRKWIRDVTRQDRRMKQNLTWLARELQDDFNAS